MLRILNILACLGVLWASHESYGRSDVGYSYGRVGDIAFPEAVRDDRHGKLKDPMIPIPKSHRASLDLDVQHMIQIWQEYESRFKGAKSPQEWWGIANEFDFLFGVLGRQKFNAYLDWKYGVRYVHDP